MLLGGGGGGGSFATFELCCVGLRTSVAYLTNFSFEFFYEIFTEDGSLLLLYHRAKKSKMTKNSNQGGHIELAQRTFRNGR